MEALPQIYTLYLLSFAFFFGIFDLLNASCKGRKTFLKKAKNYAIPQITDF